MGYNRRYVGTFKDVYGHILGSDTSAGVITHQLVRIRISPCRRCIWENIHHWRNYTSRYASPKETLCFDEPDRRRKKKSVCLADANVCRTLRMHFGHPTSANPPRDTVFARPGKSAQTCRLYRASKVRATVCKGQFPPGTPHIREVKKV